MATSSFTDPTCIERLKSERNKDKATIQGFIYTEFSMRRIFLRRIFRIRNFLKLNDSKTEILIIGPKSKPVVDISSLIVGLHAKCTVDYVRNLGVIFDNRFDFCRHVNNLVKCSFYHIRNIAKIRGYLTKSLAETLFHAFVSSRLDYCNSLLYGLPSHVLKKLQQVQNAAAQVVTLTNIRTNIPLSLNRYIGYP